MKNKHKSLMFAICYSSKMINNSREYEFRRCDSCYEFSANAIAIEYEISNFSVLTHLISWLNLDSLNFIWSENAR